jgi:hypothetical protein
MLSPSRRKAVLLLLLILALFATSGAWAASSPVRNERPSRVAAYDPASFLGRTWNLLAALWAKEGCQIDPDGRCVPHSAPAATVTTTQTDTGCQIDPDGRCHF